MSAVITKAATGIILPLYIYPGASWEKVVRASKTHHSVRIVSIVNPSNGPGTSMDASYVSGISQLHLAGLTVLGYVFTAYASRKENSVLADMRAYKTWYDVDGIMFDEMSVSPGHERYYSSLNRRAKTLGLRISIGNPGKAAPEAFGDMDILNIYEDSDLPRGLFLNGINIRREKCSIIAYGVKSFANSDLAILSNSASLLYLTNRTLPNPYDRLPSFFLELMDSLEEFNETSNAARVVKRDQSRG